jgi:hypothetical protein
MECEGPLVPIFPFGTGVVTPSGPSGVSGKPSAVSSVVLRCEECEGVSEDALGWIALLINDEEEPDEDAYVVTYCPECAAREFPHISKLR